MKDMESFVFWLKAAIVLCPLFQGCSTCISSDWLVNGRDEDFIHSPYDIRFLTQDILIANEQVDDVFSTHFDKVFIADGVLRHSSMQETICAGTKVKISGIMKIQNRKSCCLIPIPLVREQYKYAIFFHVLKNSESATQCLPPAPFAFVIKHKNDVNLLPLSILQNLQTSP